MSSAIVTLIGFYGYDPTLFDDLDLPTGVEKDLLVDSILMRGGEYEVVYNNPVLLKSMIGSWSKRWKPVFENWVRATSDIGDISPLENYDRYENWTDSNESHSTDVMSGSGTTHGVDASNSTGSVSGTDTVSAYDSSALVNNTGTNQNNNTNTSSTSDVSSSTDTTSTANTSGSGSHEGHIHGNIGVTTSAAMFREFYDVLARYGNIYESIATIFLQAFVIPIL